MSYYNKRYNWYLPKAHLHSKLPEFSFDGWDENTGAVNLGKYRNFLAFLDFHFTKSGEQLEVLESIYMEELVKTLRAKFEDNEPYIRMLAKKFGYNPHDLEEFIYMFICYWNNGGMLVRWD